MEDRDNVAAESEEEEDPGDPFVESVSNHYDMTPEAWEQPDPDAVPNLQNRQRRQDDLDRLDERYGLSPDQQQADTTAVPSLQTLARNALGAKADELEEAEDEAYDGNFPSDLGNFKEDARMGNYASEGKWGYQPPAYDEGSEDEGSDSEDEDPPSEQPESESEG